MTEEIAKSPRTNTGSAGGAFSVIVYIPWQYSDCTTEYRGTVDDKYLTCDISTITDGRDRCQLLRVDKIPTCPRGIGNGKPEL